jgi:NAD(P)H-hydrate epimerase
MRVADAAAPVPVSVLVRRAGWAVAVGAVELMGGVYGRRVVVVAGKGNNGADGRAAATFLARRGALVRVLPADTVGPGARLPDADLVIDAAYGTGFRGAYQPPAPAGAPVLAVDVPSGLSGDTGAVSGDTLRAALTVTMAALKPGLLLGEGPARVGRVEVADIGLPVGTPKAHLVDDGDRSWLAPRPRTTHKWATAVWIVAGSPGMRGAPQLCTRAAQRAGAGMVRIGSPGVPAADQPPGEAVAVGLPADGWDAVVVAELGRFHALVVGPGLGRSDSVRTGVRALVGGATVATIVDADGLNALGPAADVAAVVAARPEGAGPVVLTPHDGEFARLAGAAPGDDRVGSVRDLARRTGAVVLLKGSTTIVADPAGVVLFAASGDARLATAGTGDVLSGVVGAFLAAGLDGLHAAGLAAHVHGRAAGLGPPVGLVAGDLPDLLPAVLGGR